MELIIKDSNTSLEVKDEIFNYPFNEALVHQAVVAYMNAARSGNSAQKTRSEVRGGGRKPWAQKGTGRARAGSIRSPIWRSGGVTFASKQRDYSQKINKKMYKRAIRSIISELCRNERLIVLSEFECQSHKTKNFISKMKDYELDNALILKNEINETEYLASRNLINFDVCDIESMNPLILLQYDKVIVTSEAIRKIEEQLI